MYTYTIRRKSFDFLLISSVIKYGLRESYGWDEDIHTIVLQVQIQPDVLKVRMLERNNERDQWKFDHWDEYIASIQRSHCTWCGIPRLEYDNSEPLPTAHELCELLQLKRYF